MKKLLVIALLCPLLSLAQNCNCDVTLTKGSDGGIYRPDLSNVAAGKKICIAADTYTYISLGKIKGSEGAPITIINCGGQVISNGTGGYGFRIAKSQYFRITGTGTNGIQYGLKTFGINGGTPSGISVMDSVSDYEIDHMELQNVGVGIFTSYPPQDNNPGTWGPNWTGKNERIHKNYIHNAGGEAMYIGETSNSYSVAFLTSTIIVGPQLDSNVSVYENIIDSAGWDGIQLASSPNSKIYNNTIKNTGQKNLPVQQAALIFGGACSGSVYNNYIENCTGNGIQIFAIDTVRVTNNTIIRAGTTNGQQSVIANDIPTLYPAAKQVVIFRNNVINYPNLTNNTPALKIFNGNGNIGMHAVDSNLFCIPNGSQIITIPVITINAPGGSITQNINTCYALALDTTNVIQAPRYYFPLTVYNTNAAIVLRSDKAYRIYFIVQSYAGKTLFINKASLNGTYYFPVDRFCIVQIIAENSYGDKYSISVKR